MSINEIPHIDECSSSFSEEEAFSHAKQLYDRAVEHNISEPTRKLLSGLDYAVFRQAMELQLGGLNLLGTIELDEDNALPISFAGFGVDHLLWGMSAAANGQVRVATQISKKPSPLLVSTLGHWM